MLKEMAKRALAVVLLFLSATFIHAGVEERAPLERATWVWNNSITQSATKRDDLLRFCAQRKIGVLFLYAPMDHLQERPEEFHAFLAAAHREKMRVEALAGAPRWAFERENAERFVTAVQVFNSSAKSAEESFDGIHLD